MRVLFYVEPITERDTPTWKEPWIHFAKMMMASIRRDNPGAEFCCIVGDGLEDAASTTLSDCHVGVLHHTELVPRFGRNALEATIAWYSAPTAAALDEMAALLRSRLPDIAWQPDACITFSSAPFLSTAFPGAAVLYFELGLVSRSPFPGTAYLDPLGMFNNSYPRRHADAVRNHVANAAERQLVAGFRQKYLPLIATNNPIASTIAPLLAQYEGAVLLSLQFSQYYGYDAHAKYTDQYDLLIQTLVSVPPEIAVVAVEHPQFPIMKPETVAYLRSRHPNFIWFEEFRSLPSASQYLLEHVDLVITVSSSVGLQALLWQKPLIVLGNSHLDVIADAHDLGQVPYLIRRPWPDYKENVLAWHLSRYTIPFELLLNHSTLTERIEAARRCVATGDYASCFEAPFADISRIAQAYAVDLDEPALTATAELAVASGPSSPEPRCAPCNDVPMDADNQPDSVPRAAPGTTSAKTPSRWQKLLDSIRR